MQALLKLFDPVLTWAARRYQAAVATELKKYGLRYEDLYDPQLNMVERALPGCCSLIIKPGIHQCHENIC